MLRIRAMREADILFAIRLSNQENWGITRGDLTRILHLDPRGSLIAVIGTERVGLATTASYGRTLGWIGNVIVDRKYRGRHIGQALVRTAVRYLQGQGIEHVALYCFNDNVKFYRKLGFKEDVSFIRLQRKPKPLPYVLTTPPRGRLPLRDVFRTDKKAFGADRSRLIRSLLRTRGGWYEGNSSNRSAISFLLVKKYKEMYEFGPWVCIKPTENSPRELLQLAMSKAAKKTIEVSCLSNHRLSLRLLQENGFIVVNNGHRMFLGQVVKIGQDKANYALGFLDKG